MDDAELRREEVDLRTGVPVEEEPARGDFQLDCHLYVENVTRAEAERRFALFLEHVRLMPGNMAIELNSNGKTYEV